MEKGLYYCDGTKYIFISNKKPTDDKSDAIIKENKELKELISYIKDKLN